MQNSFRNTLYGLAILAAAGLLADQANAQTVTLEEETVALSPEAAPAVPEEISLFDEEIEEDISLPGGNGLISPAQPETTKEAAQDIIPVEAAPQLVPEEDDDFDDDFDEDIDISIESPALGNSQPTLAPQVKGRLLGGQPVAQEEQIAAPISNELFTRMSDLEKQTTLLNLELKKERVRNEIEAVRAQRYKAQQEEEARIKEEERKEQEWQNEQNRLMVEEQRKLREAEAVLEQLRQEKIVKAYKETALAATQKWIKKNAEVYAQMAKKDAQNKEMMEDVKKKMAVLKQSAEDVKAKAENARIQHDKKVANLESQISILKTRLEAEIEASKKKEEAVAAKQNPFAVGGNGGSGMPQGKAKLSSEYAIMEIMGQGDELAAKLINNEGDVFLAKIGTTLRNGYTIDDIAKTYLSAVKDNEKDYLYFSAGGILDREPINSDINIKAPEHPEEQSATNNRSTNTTRGIPSLGQGMFVR